jgi:hypothetical protein
MIKKKFNAVLWLKYKVLGRKNNMSEMPMPGGMFEPGINELITKEVSHCDTDAVIEKMENIATLKNLRQQVIDGKTSLPISVEAINDEIESQRQSMEDAIAQCGSLAGIPEEAIAEIAEENESLEEGGL